MTITMTRIDGVAVIEMETHIDERGFFARSFSSAEFATNGLFANVVDINVSWNKQRGTLRGMHYQLAPHEEPKLVRCTSGSIFDVAVDLRPQSPTYLDWFGLNLDSDNRLALHVPAGCAHGFITLEDATEVFYVMGGAYVPQASAGVRWDDPAIAIEWPIEPSVISPRDASYEDIW